MRRGTTQPLGLNEAYFRQWVEEGNLLTPTSFQPGRGPASPRRAAVASESHKLSHAPYSQVRVQPTVASRVDASVQVTDLEGQQVPLPLPGPQPTPSTSRSADAGVSSVAAEAAAPRAAQTHSRSRTRAQVQRNSYEILLREVQQLTPERPPPGGSNIRRIITVGLGGSYRAPAVDKAGAMASAGNQAQDAPPATALQGPLAYDKPKGIAAVLLPIICVPTDALDMQVLFKSLGRAFLALSKLLLQLSFLAIPAWLWLARHELLISHIGDAVAILLAGLLLFVGGGAAVSASAASASQRQGIIVAGKSALPSMAAAPSSATSSSYPSATPPSTNGVAGAPYVNGPSPAPSADPPAASSSRFAAPAPAAGGAPAPAASVSVVYPPQQEPHVQRAPTPTDQAVAAQSTDPMISQIKQRIIKLEKVLYGNELSEADIPRDALHSRVVTLCTELGVPCGGPGGSQRTTATELDRQLQAVEVALGVA